MTDVDLALILDPGDYLRRSGNTLVGDPGPKSAVIVKGTLTGATTPLPPAPAPGDLWLLGTPIPTAAPDRGDGSPAQSGDGIVWDGTHWTNTGPIQGAGVPPAGTTGQQLVKTGAASYATAWQNKTVVDVRDYGAVGDGTTNDTVAIAAALTAAGAIAGTSTVDDTVQVHLAAGARYLCIGLTVPARVKLVGNGARLTASAAGTIVTLTGAQAQVEDINFVGMGAGTAVEGVYVQTGPKNAVRRCNFDQLAGSAIKVRAGATWIRDCFAQNCLLDDGALAAPTGVLDVNTTDCWISDSEFTASQAAMSTSGNAYAVVLAGAMHSVTGIIAEISDHGWFIKASNVKMTNCRADLNRGHGFVFDANSSGVMSTCQAVSNSRETTNTYDGFNFVNTSRWMVDACTASTTGNLHRYGFNDATSSASTFNQFGASCLSTGHGTAPLTVGAFAGGRVACTDGPFLDMAAAATTHDVQLRGWPANRWNLKSVSAVNFTNWTNGITGQRLLVRGDGFTTFVHNVSVMRMKGAANLLAAANTLYEFVNVGGIWFEL